MAAQQVDAALVSAAQGLSVAVAGGSNSAPNLNPQIETGAKSKSNSRKSVTVKTKKTTKTRLQLKRHRGDLSHSSGSVHDNSSNPPVLIPCRSPGCPLTFSSIIEADAHVKHAHAAPRVDTLDPSRRLTNTSSPRVDSYVDQQSPQSISPKQCNNCQKFFSSDIDLASHISRRHSQPSLKCPIPSCGALFQEELGLVNHVIASHNSANSQPVSLNRRILVEIFLPQCQV